MVLGDIKPPLNSLFVSDIDGNTYFHEVLYSTLRNHFRHEIFPDHTSQRALRHIFKEEKGFYLRLELMRLRRKKIAVATEEVNNVGLVRIINPLYSYFYFIMVFLSWKAFSIQTSKNKPSVTIFEVDEEESPRSIAKP